MKHILCLTDNCGIVLYAAGDAEMIDQLDCRAGSDWSEQCIGTNGAGTALAGHQAVSIVGPEHFLADLHGCASTGAPLEVDGSVLGAIHFITGESSCSPVHLALVTQLTHAIEHELIGHGECRRREDEMRSHNAELREADRRKNEFLAVLAHELRNPLAAVRNGLQVIKQLEKHDSVIGKTRDIMERQVQHLGRLVDDLLDISRIVHGQVQLRKEVTLLSTIVHDAVEISRPLFEQRHLQLIVSVPPEPIYVLADTARLEQILTNLLNNAAQYTDEGREVRLNATRQDKDVILKVSDSGIGIPEELLPRIFEPFQHAAEDHWPTGLGLGLALVADLVKLHGGTVKVNSPGVGKGTEFVLRLPIISEQPLPRDVKSVVASTKHRILVVDDNEDAARSLATLLRLEGHEVRLAFGGKRALEIVQEELPTILLLDLGMPEVDGYAVAQQIRAQFGPNKVKLVAMTGYGQDEDRRRSEQAGFDCHLVKPVEPEDLKQVLAWNINGE